MDLSLVFCVVRHRSLCRADQPSGGVLASVVFVCDCETSTVRRGALLH
jgi:hypothetical protein